MKALVIAPHQDDEVLGCGGTLHRIKDAQVMSLGHKTVGGTTPPMISFESGDYVQKCREACRLLGISDDVIFSGFTSEIFHEDEHTLAIRIAKCVQQLQPRWVFLPWYDDVHQDHRTTARAARLGTRGLDGIVQSVFYYPVPGASEGFVPNVYVPLSDEDVLAKKAAFEVYAAEQRAFPHPRSWPMIEAQMRVFGAAIGAAWAEGFETKRHTLEV